MKHNKKQPPDLSTVSDLRKTGYMLSSGIKKTATVTGKWLYHMPKNIKAEGNSGFLKTLYEEGIHPNDVVTYRLIMTGVSLAIYEILSKDVGAGMFIGLNILDAVDGKLARAYKMASPEGEKYDAGADKAVVIAGDMVALSQITNPVSLLQAIMSYTVNWELLRRSFLQRGSFSEQLSLFKGLMLDTTNPTFTEKKSKNAATNWGKYKTIFQMVSNSALLVSGTPAFQALVKEELSRDIFQAGCVTLSTIAGILSVKSIQSRK